MLPIKLAIYRSSPDARRMFARTWQEDGVVGMWRVLRFLLGTSHVDPALAWRFRQLGLLPEGTLGRVFWASLSAQRIGFPGEPGGLPERMIGADPDYWLDWIIRHWAGNMAAFTPAQLCRKPSPELAADMAAAAAIDSRGVAAAKADVTDDVTQQLVSDFAIFGAMLVPCDGALRGKSAAYRVNEAWQEALAAAGRINGALPVEAASEAASEPSA